MIYVFGYHNLRVFFLRFRWILFWFWEIWEERMLRFMNVGQRFNKFIIPNKISTLYYIFVGSEQLFDVIIYKNVWEILKIG